MFLSFLSSKSPRRRVRSRSPRRKMSARKIIPLNIDVLDVVFKV